MKHVQNNLRVEERNAAYGYGASATTGSSGWGSGNSASDTGMTTSATARNTTTSESIKS